jgi:enediyne biosynthesis protein E4
MTTKGIRQRVLWVIWAIALAGSIGGVVALDRAAASSGAAAGSAAAARFGFHLQESAKRLGVDFVHQAPTFDARLAHIMPQVAAMGASVAVADFDRDGWEDFYVTNSGEGSLNRLYRNNGDGTFTDVAGSVGLADVNRAGTGVSMGALWGDFDNDGF